MDYYFKLITKQDVTRSFVVNKKAAEYFFDKKLIDHGDEETVFIKHKESNFEETKIVLHQDFRLLIKNRDFSEGDIAFFRKIQANFFELTIINSDSQIDIVMSKFNENNYYLSNTNIQL